MSKVDTMANKPLNGSLRSVLTLLEVQHLRDAADQELVRRFAQSRDEAAFRVIAERHGPMVHGVCKRALGCRHDAEDAFQATFLIFAKRAGSLRNAASLAGWLHGVARRVTREFRRSQHRRRRREQTATTPAPKDPLNELTWAEVKTGLDEELERLPAAYRDVLVLCYLEGQTRDEAAQRLGVESGVVKGRLERGRKALADRLKKRGLALSTGLLAVAVSPGTVSATVKAASLLARSQSVDGIASPSVMSLTQTVLKGMTMSKFNLIAASLACVLVLVAGVGFGIAQTPAIQQDVEDRLRVARALQADTDEGFIRRVSKDLRGIEPSPTEIYFFVNNKDARKRQTLVDLFVQEREAKRTQASRQARYEQAMLEALENSRIIHAHFEVITQEAVALEAHIAAMQRTLQDLEAVRNLKDGGTAEVARRIERLKSEIAAAQRHLAEAMAKRAAIEQKARLASKADGTGKTHEFERANLPKVVRVKANDRIVVIETVKPEDVESIKATSNNDSVKVKTGVAQGKVRIVITTAQKGQAKVGWQYETTSGRIEGQKGLEIEIE